MKLWRICKAEFSRAAFTGEGARLYAGRWNPVGVPMVYTSSSLSLASVEYFVHLEHVDAPDDLVSMTATLPKSASIERLKIEKLPADWREIDNLQMQALGAKWAEEKRSLALEVPSVVVAGEWNVLLNPAHPEFKKLTISEPEPFRFDQRMFQHRS